MNYIVYLLISLLVRLISLKGAPRWKFLDAYISGEGRDRDVSKYFIRPVKDKLFALMESKDFGRSNNAMTNLHLSLQKKVGWWASWHYEGGGFGERPELFYLIGGFTSSWEFQEKGIRFFGEDVYDWHPDSSGEYFTSGMALENKWMKILFSLASRVSPQYFPRKGYPMGNPGVSNKLWADIPWGREFTSTWDFVVPWEEISSDSLSYLESRKQEDERDSTIKGQYCLLPVDRDEEKYSKALRKKGRIGL